VGTEGIKYQTLCRSLGGIEGSNPSPSSAESGANLTFCGCEDARHQG